MMTTLWIDATAGVAGDMLLGALIDAGADRQEIQRALDAVAPGAIRLETSTVVRGAMRATHARVLQVAPAEVERTWVSIRGLLEDADLDPLTRRRALAVFGALARAEAHVHGMSEDEVHFHEVGGLDAIGDVVGVCEALRLLGVEQVLGSWVALGSGRIRAAHGFMPVPAPAVAELARGWQVRAMPVPVERLLAAHGHPHDHPHEHPHDHSHDHAHGHSHDHAHDHSHEHPRTHPHGREEAPAVVADARDVGELATPTGLALLTALSQRCTELPVGTVTAVGVGAGTKDMPWWANVVRCVLLEEAPGADDAAAHRGPDAAAHRGPDADQPATDVVEIAANIDDLDARLVPGVITTLLEAGALDAWSVPIHMKKGRPALTLHLLAGVGDAQRLADLLLELTPTLGVRMTPMRRRVLDRTWRTIDVDIDGTSHRLEVKVGVRQGRVVHAQPEFSSLAALAREAGVSELAATAYASAALGAAGLLPGRLLPEPPVPHLAQGARRDTQ